MTFDEKLVAMEQRIRALVLQRTANMVQVAPIKLATSDGLADGLDGRPSDQPHQREAHRYQHAGFRSRPVVETQAVLLMVEGGSGKTITVAEDDGRGTDVALDAGETKVYSPAKPACRIWLDKNGVIHIDADAGTDVIVNGGTAKVHRVGDHADAGTLTLTFSAPTAITGTYVDPDGVSTPVATGAPLQLKAKASEGADHFKG